MNVDQTTVSQPGTVNLSTTLEPGTVRHESGGGAPSISEANGKDESIQGVLEAELKSIRDAEGKAEEPEPKAEDKPEKDARPEKDEGKEKAEKEPKDEKPERERAQDGKFAKTDKEPVEGKEGEPEKAATGQEATERRPSEGRHTEAPARFLPKEKELWGNVPNSVKAAIHRVSQEYEAEVSQHREASENWQKLSKFDQMAKQHNTSVSDALERYTNLDGLLQSNPIEAIRQILATRGITPEQYAHHVVNNPDAHRAPAAPAAPDPVVQQMTGKVEQLEATIEQMRQSQAAAQIIEPFRAANPRYDELQDDIALFLQSGKIPASFSPLERLEAAYDMAVRINPTSNVEALQPREATAAKTERPARPDAGTKSIRGAPDNGQDTEVEEGDDDIRDMLRKQMRKLSA